MTPANVYILTSPFTPTELKLSNATRQLYRKKIAYATTFVQNGRPVEITEDMLIRFYQSSGLLLSNGYEIPLTPEHVFSNDPDKTRGYARRFELDRSADGNLELYAVCEFKNDEAEQQYKNQRGCSIFVPLEWTDGKGNKYINPVKHIALTDNPMLPHLPPFQAIAASLTGDTTMLEFLRRLAAKMGLAVDNKTEKELQDAIDAKISAGPGQPAPTDPTPAPSQPPVQPGQPAPQPSPAPAPGTPPQQPIPRPETAPAAIVASNPVVLSLARQNRDTKLDALVATGRITPAVRDDLKKTFCTDGALVLSLTEPSSTAVFDATIAALEKNAPVIGFAERSGKQIDPETALALSNYKAGDGTNNPLLADANKRREAFKEQQALVAQR